jgi:hypothetical protein
MKDTITEYAEGPYPLLQWLARKSARLVRGLPRVPAVDHAYHFLRFYTYHGRRPTCDGAGLNDVCYFMKISGNLEDPLRVFVSDKELVKLFVAARVGAEFTVPTIAVLGSPEAVDEYEFPPTCVIKPTHLSGPVILRRDGAPISRPEIRDWFRQNHYQKARERNYLALRPKVIVEEFAFGLPHASDYKVLCWNGVPKLIEYVDRDATVPRASYFTADWTFLPYAVHFPLGRVIEPPGSLPTMLDVARKLSRDFSLMRVDFYTDGTRVAIGELTNVHGGAHCVVDPPEGDQKLAEVLLGPQGLPWPPAKMR